MKIDDTWFLTFTGKRFFPFRPQAADIDIRDIAHALSLICRFGGHCRNHYSVGQHSILTSYALPGHLRLAGLLHDATEAYLGDIIRPIKLQLPAYREAESRLEHLIERKFGLRLSVADRYVVKSADNAMLVTERNALLNQSAGYKWREDIAGVCPLGFVDVSPMQPRVVEERFLEEFRRLTGGVPQPQRRVPVFRVRGSPKGQSPFGESPPAGVLTGRRYSTAPRRRGLT